MTRWPLAIAAATTALTAIAAEAQPLGTFRWQLQPFCNVVTVNVLQQGAVYTLDGYDNQCGGPQRAPLVGIATPNPDGSIGLGFQLVTVPGGRGLQIDARITLPAASGIWADSAGNAGSLVLGANTGGNARALPAAPTVIPPAFGLLNDGAFLARGTDGVGPIPASGAGTRMMWHPSKAAFRAGHVGGTQWDEANVGFGSTAMGVGTMAGGDYGTAVGFGATAEGNYSTATGYRTIASGHYSTALGTSTTASGHYSIAMGASTTASGSHSTAMGDSTIASGGQSTALGAATVASAPYSTAIGRYGRATGEVSLATGFSSLASGFSSTALGANTIASGSQGTAMGFQTTASGVTSTALGSVTRAEGLVTTVMGTYATATAAAPGSFVYGDRSTVGAGSGIVTSNAPNQFLVRAAGGVTFYSNGALTAGVTLASGGSGWGVVSDVRMKEHFREVAADDVLSAIAAMPVRTWSYKTQESSIRHMGPTAQDFRAAFGLGESDVRINTIDADGVALAGVKALEARTRALPDDVTAIRAQLAALATENADLRARLARLETLLDKR